MINKNKRVPSFWWDFEKNSVVVESDDKEYPTIAIYPLVNEFADEEIEMAEKLIEDLNSGRKDYRRLSKLNNKREIL